MLNAENVILAPYHMEAVLPDDLRFLGKNAGRYGLDSGRIVVWGDSAGGHLAQMLTLADPDAFSVRGPLRNSEGDRAATLRMFIVGRADSQVIVQSQ